MEEGPLGDGLPDRRLLQRYARSLPAQPSLSDQLAEAIHHLHEAGGSDNPLILAKGLELLVRHLGGALATLVMPHGNAHETSWWYPESEEAEPPRPVSEFCTWLTAHPERILAIRDLRTDAHTAHQEELRGFPYQAALGCALRRGETARALVFVFFDQPQAFPRTAFALLESVAGFMARVLEVEELKHSVNRLEDALAITRAVMEDNSTWDPETDLPNLRYLEIWQKALLASDQRPSSLMVAECQVTLRSKRDVARIRAAAEGIRACDLLVRAGRDRFLLIFRNTPRSMAHTMLLRLRTQLGNPPLGATVWIPGPESHGLDSCRPHLEAALAESRATVLPTLVWSLPEGWKDESDARKSGEPKPWQPATLAVKPGGPTRQNSGKTS
jgi:GGDEF domain-containing protein